MNVKKCEVPEDPLKNPANWPDPCDPNAKICSGPTKPSEPPVATGCAAICIERLLHPWCVTKKASGPCMPEIKTRKKLKKSCSETSET